MATAKKTTPPAPEEKKRDYKAERARTKANKNKLQEESKPQAKAAPGKPKPNKVNEELKKTVPSQDIALAIIASDPNQPRKFFDMAELLELSKSILQHGVIEPILIRPEADGFIIVFGERRFRASLMAAEVDNRITSIPAMVKVMTADEAFDLQMAENLHRKDPHPIEEAYAFKKMLERGKSSEDVAALVCKSTKFVAMRLMLNDLIQQWQDVFFANKINIGDAVKIAKLGPDAQLEIYTEEVPVNWKDLDDFEISDLDYLIGQNEHNLDDAAFNIQDADLYAEAGPCVGCKFNSLSNLVLFHSDKTETGICSNTACYAIKRSRSYKNSIEAVLLDPEVLFIQGSNYNLSDNDKLKIAEVKKLGVTIANVSGVKFNPEQLIAPSWNKFVEDNPIDQNDEDQQAYESRVKEEFDDEVNKYERFLKEYETAKAEGRIKRAFIVCGNNEGKFVNILLSKDQQITMNMQDGSPVDMGVAEKIKAIEQRVVRAGELASEKIWGESLKLVDADDFSGYVKPTELNPVENLCLKVAMFQAMGGHNQMEFIEEALGLEDNGINVYSILENLQPDQYSLLCRFFLKSQIFPTAGSPDNDLPNFAGFQVIKSLFPEAVAAIEQGHKDKAEKRAKNAKKKIDALLNPKPAKDGKETAEEEETED